ncbi:MAG: NAD(P)-dependent oxidoreductase [Proteobacteria bacterium]|nr:NAD(P)-dependent oxidoreductase [Pseudomonadota bacterium]MDA1072104.1 NAD(P)-dependent oxidoreductase [Pseudomonadota bacterium]
MTLLVTGGTGLVMSNVILHWLQDDPAARVVSIDLGPPDALARRFFAPVAERIDFVCADLRDAAALDALATRGISHIAHGAAITPGVGEREKAQAALTVGVNVMGTVHVLELARRLPGLARLLHVSTGSVYGDDGPADGAPLPEDGYVAPFPTNLYAISKLSGELIAQRFAALFGLPLTMVRLASVYGPMDRDTPGRVIKCAANVMMHKAIAGEPWTVANGTAVGDWIHSGDVGRAICALLRAPRLHHTMYNIAYGEAVSLDDLAGRIAAVVPGSTWNRTDGPARADVSGNPARLTGAWGAYDTSRLRGDTGWRPRALDEALADYAGWLRSFGSV